ncbi:MAG TPA: HAD family hydrolase [Candidatus Dojkabacteria bacterium]|jgi:putative hydrolase of the HAD superfamily
MIKYVFFDVDGVLINSPLYYSQYYAKQNNLDYDKEMLPFFTGIFRKAGEGKVDLKEIIAPWLKKWGFQGSVDEYLKNWFEFESDVDQEVIELVKTLREKGINCFLTTQQEKYRFDYMWNNLKFKEYFDGRFPTYEINYTKTKKGYWETILKILKVKDPHEVLMIDDSKEVIKTAEEVGLTTILFQNKSDLDRLQKL